MNAESVNDNLSLVLFGYQAFVVDENDDDNDSDSDTHAMSFMRMSFDWKSHKL